MAKVGTVTFLTEELIRQLPDMDYSESHQDLFLKAVNILKELLNVLQTMEMCSDIDMKEEIQEEEEKCLEDGEIGLQSDFSQPHSPVVIKVKKEQLNEESESKLSKDEEGEDFQSDGCDEDFSPSKVGAKKNKKLSDACKEREKRKNERSKVENFVLYHSIKEPVLYHCLLCEKNFSSSDELLCHDKEIHMNDVNEYKCPECGKTSSREATFQHFAKEHRKRNYKRERDVERFGRRVLHCLDCDQLFLERQPLRKHYLDAHNKWCNKKTCLLCLKEFDKYNDTVYHEQTEHENRNFCCRFKHVEKSKQNKDVCQKEFTTYEELQQHYSTEHPVQETYTCHICGEFFKKQYRAKYLRHVKQHSMTEKTVECPDCDEKFFFEADLKRHERKHKKKFMCDICDFRTGWKGALETHMLTHTDEKPFVCNVCGMGFKLAYYLQKHSVSHSEVRKYECEYCGKAFKAKRNLNEHTKIHTGKFGGYCEICKKGFTQKYNLTLHNFKHHT